MTAQSVNRPVATATTLPVPEGCEAVVSPEAMAFVGSLVARFRPRVRELLEARRERRERIDAGQAFHFLEGTRDVREASWKVAALPSDLLDRRVEITGPTDRKMIINALGSGANVFMADLEDSTAPTWENVMRGQVNLMDAVRRTIRFDDPTSKKVYELGERIATLLVRPRGLHLLERHILVNGEPATASLVDFGFYFFHNVKALFERKTGPYFYLPKLESHLEARLWNDVFVAAQKALGVPNGTIKATVLIETLPAAFEMDEILFELKDHSAGLNCGRWDYIFSFIKSFRASPNYVLPDRSLITMEQPMMRAYTQLVVKTCHRRGVHAIGGMAAQIPIKNDPVANDAALAKVRADKTREVRDGHDGTWVAHPGLVAIAKEIFDAGMPGKNQLDILREDFQTTAQELVECPKGERTENGLRHNVRVGIQYLEAWLRGSGCVPIANLMEDAATAEISRSQVWQWLRHGAVLDGKDRLTVARFRQVVAEEMGTIEAEVGKNRFEQGKYAEARDLFDRLATAAELTDFLTVAAYDMI